MPFLAVASALVVFVLSVALTGVVRAYALRRQLIDRPNERSSHSRPTPRGGGLAIVFAHLAGLAALGAGGVLAPHAVVGLAGAGAAVAAIGFADDHGHVPALWRALGHVAAAAWGLWWLGGLPAIPLGGGVWEPGLAGNALGVVGLAWLLNLYNFMDGIDGLAGSEAVFAALAAAVLAAVAGAEGQAWALGLLAAASAGFLVWNWPPARIFMGDAGSGFLGLMLGLLGVAAAGTGAVPLAVWAILLGVFIADATVTLLRRMVRGERWYAAHRSHAYQHLARRWGSHRRVTLAVAAVNLGWLLPLAVAAWHWPGASLPIAVLAVAPLAVLAFRLGAGVPEPGRTAEAGTGPGIIAGDSGGRASAGGRPAPRARDRERGRC